MDRETELTTQIKALYANYMVKAKPLIDERKAIRVAKEAERERARKEREEELDREWREQVAQWVEALRLFGQGMTDKDISARMAVTRAKARNLVHWGALHMAGGQIDPAAIEEPEAFVAALKYRHKTDLSYTPRFDPRQFLDEKYQTLAALLLEGGYAVDYQDMGGWLRQVVVPAKEPL